jgi:hypothetical protein
VGWSQRRSGTGEPALEREREEGGGEGGRGVIWVKYVESFIQRPFQWFVRVHARDLAGEELSPQTQ